MAFCGAVGSAVGSAVAGAAAAVPAIGGAAANGENMSDNDLARRCFESAVHWNWMWGRLRNAPTMADCEARLNLLKHHHPRLRKYVDFLWRNVALWAKVAFVWKPTLGYVVVLFSRAIEPQSDVLTTTRTPTSRYESSQMQEGFHWTVKSGTQGRCQPLHQLPFHVASQVKKRNDNWFSTTEGSLWREWNEGAVLKGLAKSGCQQLIDKGREFLTDEGSEAAGGRLCGLPSYKAAFKGSRGSSLRNHRLNPLSSRGVGVLFPCPFALHRRPR